MTAVHHQLTTLPESAFDGSEFFSDAPHGVLPREIIAAAARGWRLLPVEARGKKPLLKRWPSVATNDLKQIEKWSAQFPDCNWGIVTDARSGVFAVDCDGESGLDWLKARIDDGETLPESWAVATGHGLHLYFKSPPGLTMRTSAGRIAPSVDIRGEGGYVVAPPSVHSCGKRYAVIDDSCPISFAPGWLVVLLQSQPHNIKATKPIQQIGALYPGQRNDGLTRFGGSLRRKGLSQPEIEILLLQSNLRRCVPPLEPAEVSRIAVSVSRYPAGGPDPLEQAWQATHSSGPYPSRYEEFCALARHLQAARPNADIALPLVRIAGLFGVHFTSVQQWRKKAMAVGLLVPGPQYIAHRKAGLYRFRGL